MTTTFWTYLTLIILAVPRIAAAQGTYANGSYTNGPGSPLVNNGDVFMRMATGLPPFATPYATRPGDVVLLYNLNGGLAPSNWSSILHFFNPSDLTGEQGMPATLRQMFSASDENGFSNYQLFPNYLFVPEGPGGNGARANTSLVAAGNGSTFYYFASDLTPEPGIGSLMVLGGIMM